MFSFQFFIRTDARRHVRDTGVRGFGVRRVRRAGGRGAVRPAETKVLDEPRGARGVYGTAGAGGHSAAGPAGRPVAGPLPGRRVRGRGRVGRARRRPSVRVGVRRARGRRRAGQRRFRRGGRRRRQRRGHDARAVRGGRGRRDRRVARHERVRGRADHVAGGRGQPADDRHAVDGAEEVRGRGGGHVRVRPADGRLAGQGVRATMRPRAVLVARRRGGPSPSLSPAHRLLRRVRFVGQRLLAGHRPQAHLPDGRRGQRQNHFRSVPLSKLCLRYSFYNMSYLVDYYRVIHEIDCVFEYIMTKRVTNTLRHTPKINGRHKSVNIFDH